MVLTGAAHADSVPTPVFHITLTNQAFKPDTLTVPADQRFKIMIANKDALPAEFESSDLHREVVLPGHTELPVYVGPLKPGTYHYFNDFHPQTTGTLIVKAAGQ